MDDSITKILMLLVSSLIGALLWLLRIKIVEYEKKRTEDRIDNDGDHKKLDERVEKVFDFHKDISENYTGIVDSLARLETNVNYFPNIAKDLKEVSFRLDENDKDHSEIRHELETLKNGNGINLSNMSGKKLLIVDDQIEMAEYIQEYIQSKGVFVNCHSVTNYKDAKNAIDVIKFDAAIVDYNLSGNSGLEFAEYCRVKKYLQNGSTDLNKINILLYSGAINRPESWPDYLEYVSKETMTKQPDVFDKKLNLIL